MRRLAFTVPGCPVPYQRTAGRGSRRYMAPESRAYRRVVQSAASLVVGKWLDALGCSRARSTPYPMTKPKPKACRCEWCATEVAISLNVHLPDKRTRDLSNVLKAIEDALNGIAFHDDRQIAEVHVYRYLDRERPRVEVLLQELP